MPQPVMQKKLKLNSYEDLQDLLELTPPIKRMKMIKPVQKD